MSQPPALIAEMRTLSVDEAVTLVRDTWSAQEAAWQAKDEAAKQLRDAEEALSLAADRADSARRRLLQAILGDRKPAWL